MYKLVLWRYGARIIEQFETLPEANKQFNFTTEYEIGFPECILDENNVIIRDGKKGVIGIKKEKRKGKQYVF